MHEKILNILSLCLKAKEKGHDAFFRYSPHVDFIEIEVYLDGWYKGKEKDRHYKLYLNKLSSEAYIDMTEVELKDYCFDYTV